MQRLNKTHSRGDTLIEVMFATVIFSLVAVGGISIMNQGTSSAQKALEITLVKQQVDSQAEVIRFLNSAYITAFGLGDQASIDDANTPAGQWFKMAESIKDEGNTKVSDFGDGLTCNETINNLFSTSGSGSIFIMNTMKSAYLDLNATPGNLKPAEVFSQVNYNPTTSDVDGAYGIWVEAIYTAPTDPYQVNAAYIDFHIRTCWDSPGQSAPSKIGTIVRLYVPKK